MTSSAAADRLELAAAEWLVFRPAGSSTPATRVVERALAAAYVRRRGNSPTARRLMADLLEPGDAGTLEHREPGYAATRASTASRRDALEPERRPTAATPSP